MQKTEFNVGLATISGQSTGVCTITAANADFVGLVTTGDLVEKIISKKVKKNNFEVISNPEFLREGEAIRDFRFPDRIVVGSNNKKIY